jgi:hypothetical protein
MLPVYSLGPLALEVIFKNQKISPLLAKPRRAKQQPPTMIFFEVDETYFRIRLKFSS